MLSCALALAACGSKMPASNGAGFSPLHPAPATRDFIVKNDKPFAREVLSHNRFCQTQKLCARMKEK